MNQLWRDIRYAARTLLRTPLFTFGIVLTLALGIGANATMFGVVDTLFLRQPPGVRRPDEVVRIYFRRAFGPTDVFTGQTTTYPTFRDLRDAGIFQSVAAVGRGQLSLGRGESAIQVSVTPVTHQYFDLLGVHPGFGRFFGAEDDHAGAPQTAVLSDGFWRRHFGADSSVIGRVLPLGSGQYTVIGVAPRDFRGIELGAPDLWLPLEATGNDIVPSEAFGTRNWMWNSVIARLKPGTRYDDVAAQATIAYRRGIFAATERRASHADSTALVVLGPTQLARGPEASKESKVSGWIGLVGIIVLLIACANVANLLLARGVARRRELAVRAGLGAGRGGLVRLLLCESLVLAVFGGLGALMITVWGGALVRGFLIPELSRDVAIVDPRVLLFAMGTVFVTGLLAGLAPAILSSRTDLSEALKSGGRGSTAGGNRTRATLLALQVALTVVLLVGAGLFVRSLRNVQHIDLGFDADRVLEASVDMGAAHFNTTESSNAAYLRILERITALPGVASAATTMAPYGWGFGRYLKVQGIDSLPPFEGGGPYVNVVSADYFRTMGMRLRQGRFLGAADAAGAEPVAVISETLAKAIGEPALGRCLYLRDKDPWCTSVVGVVADAKRGQVVAPADAMYWVPLAQADTSTVPGEIHGLVIRPRENAAALIGEIRRAIQSTGDLPYAEIHLLADRVAPEFRSWRLGATSFTMFGALALVIAAMGIFAVVAYAVAQRTQEIGIRMALGAETGQVARMILGQGVRATLAGVALGALGAWAMARALASLLYGVPPADPLVFGGVAVTLVVVSGLAAWLPARKAAAIDPMIALRSE